MTAADLPDWLAAYLPDYRPLADPQRLTGGLLNHVWRVLAHPQPVVVKHAPPHLASAPDVPLDPRRLAFEAAALALFAPDGPLANLATDAVRLPRRLAFDAERFVLAMEDVSPAEELGAALRRGRDVQAPMRALGTFIGQLHARTAGAEEMAASFHNAAVQATRRAVQYEAVAGMLEAAGVADAEALGRRAADLGARLERPGVCLVMGDLWPASVLLASDDVRLIDWEFAHYGRPLQDVAHLAAHLWMHAHRAPTAEARAAAEAAWTAFARAYAEAAPAALWTPAERADAQIHVAAELLVRTVGPFRDGFLYDGLTPERRPVQEAVAEAVRCLRDPEGGTRFDAFGA